ncbi:MAG: hypothetical protein NZT61_07840 [Deltaproteobacteria bacterium]|nr:hypothetical protein [Deltaproteobacteria bacterium]
MLTALFIYFDILKNRGLSVPKMTILLIFISQKDSCIANGVGFESWFLAMVLEKIAIFFPFPKDKLR